MTGSIFFSENDIALYECCVSSEHTSRQLLLRAAEHYAGLRGIETVDFSIKTGVYGKPFFPFMPGVHFSISHSGKYWACAFHGRPVGFDVQEHRECDFLSIARRFFHPDEYVKVERCCKGGSRSNEAEKVFFDIWSAKESYIKYTSRGLSQPMGEFSALNGFSGGGPRLISLSFGPHYSAFVCALLPQSIYRFRHF
ncbi:MAG: 4'-phosphopantetheinyl transferase family protein [Christensenellales bacterium]